MNFIFVGSFYDEKDLLELASKGSQIDYASHRFQTALLSGLSSFNNIKFVTAPNISPFPKIFKIYFSKKNFRLNDSATGVFSGIINIPIVKLISKYFRIKNILASLLEKDQESILFIYSVHSPFLLAPAFLYGKKNIKTCLIVPDLPEFMSGNRNKLYRFAKKIDQLLINKCIHKIDSFVLLSPYMKDKLPIGEKPCIQVEGIYEFEDKFISSPKEKYKTLLYAGNLDRRYGILDLLEAFSLIDKEEYRLWICGTGDSLDIIKKCQLKDSRIQYLGTFSKEEIYVLQRKATVLVNPRHSTEEYTKYSFPSKTMEYLASGTPTLMSHLACIPKEYDNHIFYFDDESVIGMKEKIIEVCEMDQQELFDFGKNAADFILQNKSSIIQAEKIVNLISKIK